MLPQYVRKHKNEIAQVWKDRVLADERIPHAKELKEESLTNHMAVLLDYLTGFLEDRSREIERCGPPITCESIPKDIKYHAREKILQYRYTIPEAMMEISHLRFLMVDQVDDLNHEGKVFHQSLDLCMTLMAHECHETIFELENRLVGVISHDLRNPIGTAIVNIHYVLSKGRTLDETLRSGLTRALKSSERALKLVEELLEFSRARSGIEFPISVARMELKALVEEFVEDYAIKRPNYFKVNGDTYGMWDCGRMAQVVSNLFDNAVKYSPAGTPIWVELDGGEKVTLKVTNIGQPILDPQAVFEAFYQTKVGPNGNGVGLGLYIVRHIIKLHNGSVEVENIPNEGKVSFKVTLPRDPSDLGPNS